MKKTLSASVIGAAFLAASFLPTTAMADISKDIGDQKLKVKFFGFSQITAESGDGLGSTENDEKDSLRFGADRVRFGYSAKMGKTFGKIQIDFIKSDESVTSGTNASVLNSGQMDEIIKDAFVGYKFDKAASLKLGQFKTPLGMDFNTSGKKLDITKRGMEKKLVLERSLGAMLSGRKIGGIFGYDIGIFNPATRGSAVSSTTSGTNGVAGDDYAYVVRGMIDWQKLHVELSYGVSEEANSTSTPTPGTDDEDYTVWDIAASYKINDLTLKGEYIDGSDIKGVNGQDESVWYLHAGYRFMPMLEGIIRHYQAEYDKGTTSSDLGNTYLGLNLFLNPASTHNARVQLNYVITSGDDGFTSATRHSASSGVVAKGYNDDVILAQFQISF